MKVDISPVYFDHGKTYQADSCTPLVQATQNNEVSFQALARGTYPGTPIPENVLPAIKSVGYWSATHPQSWGLPWHRNEGIEITFLANGTLPFSADDDEYQLSPGSLTVTRPWQQHRVGNPNMAANKLHWVILDVGVRRPNQEWIWPEWVVLSREEIKKLTTFFRQNETCVWTATKEIQKNFEELEHLVQEDTLSKPAYSKILIKINELLLSLLDLYETRNVPLQAELTSNRRSVDLFLNDLKDQLDHKWTIRSMAKHCGLKSTAFVHYCKQCTNMTPTEYLTYLRIEKGKQLLKEFPKRSILDIALDCGFSTSQYFASTFKTLADTTPTEYRNTYSQAKKRE